MQLQASYRRYTNVYVIALASGHMQINDNESGSTLASFVPKIKAWQFNTDDFEALQPDTREEVKILMGTIPVPDGQPCPVPDQFDWDRCPVCNTWTQFRPTFDFDHAADFKCQTCNFEWRD